MSWYYSSERRCAMRVLCFTGKALLALLALVFVPFAIAAFVMWKIMRLTAL